MSLRYERFDLHHHLFTHLPHEELREFIDGLATNDSVSEVLTKHESVVTKYLHPSLKLLLF